MKYVGLAALLMSTACAGEGSGAPPAGGEDGSAGPADAATTRPADAAVDQPDPDWRARTLYLVMPDRFANGDSDNDSAVAGCTDPGEPRRFHGGDIAGLRTRIDYLTELGVGALWTTPLYAQAGCGYHGYWPDLADPFEVSVDPRFGSAGEFDALLDELHAAGIAYVFDMIVNHSGYSARLVDQRPDWFHDPSSCANLGPSEIYCPLSNLPDLAQEKPEVASYLDRFSAAWVARFAIDGIRMDTAKHVPLAYLERWHAAVRAERPELVTIAEVFDGSSAATYEPFLDAGFDSAFDFSLYYAMVASFAQRQSLNRVADAVRGAVDQLGLERALRMTNMLGNHDLPRLSEEMADGMAASEAAARHRLALVTLFSVPGVPQLYAGDELGLSGSGRDNRRDMPDWVWSASTRGGEHPEALPGAELTFELVAKLTRLRRDNAALWRGGYVELWRQNGGPPAYAFLRASGSNRIVVAVNNGPTAIELSLPIANNGGIAAGDKQALGEGAVMEDLLGGPAATVTDGTLSVSLPPLRAGIYRLRY